jgi:hypothetical protein
MLTLYTSLFITSAVVYMPSAITLDLLLIPVALYTADVFSAIVHIVLDNGDCGVLTPFLDDKSVEELSSVRDRFPLIYNQSTGFQKTCFEFQKHHQYPSVILHKTFSEVSISIASITWFLHALLLLFYMTGVMNSSLFFFSTLTTCIGTLSQLAHQSAHAKESHVIIKWFQTRGILISPESHRIHHRTYNRNFAIVNGWSHSLVNWLIQPFIYYRWISGNT